MALQIDIASKAPEEIRKLIPLHAHWVGWADITGVSGAEYAFYRNTLVRLEASMSAEITGNILYGYGL